MSPWSQKQVKSGNPLNKGKEKRPREDENLLSPPPKAPVRPRPTTSDSTSVVDISTSSADTSELLPIDASMRRTTRSQARNAVAGSSTAVLPSTQATTVLPITSKQDSQHATAPASDSLNSALLETCASAREFKEQVIAMRKAQLTLDAKNVDNKFKLAADEQAGMEEERLHRIKLEEERGEREAVELEEKINRDREGRFLDICLQTIAHKEKVEPDIVKMASQHLREVFLRGSGSQKPFITPRSPSSVRIHSSRRAASVPVQGSIDCLIGKPTLPSDTTATLSCTNNVLVPIVHPPIPPIPLSSSLAGAALHRTNEVARLSPLVNVISAPAPLPIADPSSARGCALAPNPTPIIPPSSSLVPIPAQFPAPNSDSVCTPLVSAVSSSAPPPGPALARCLTSTPGVYSPSTVSAPVTLAPGHFVTARPPFSALVLSREGSPLSSGVLSASGTSGNPPSHCLLGGASPGPSSIRPQHLAVASTLACAVDRPASWSTPPTVPLSISSADPNLLTVLSSHANSQPDASIQGYLKAPDNTGTGHTNMPLSHPGPTAGLSGSTDTHTGTRASDANEISTVDEFVHIDNAIWSTNAGTKA